MLVFYIYDSPQAQIFGKEYNLKYPKDSNIVNQEGGKTLAEFPNSIELGKLGLGQDPNNDGALNYMFNK